jgi:glycosyltransferase involved in cell wall biosynthesis
MKIAIITCYDQSDYVRARTLRAAFASCDGVEVLIIKNRHKGLLRYVEVPLKILRARLTQHLDAYVITFRGYEMLLFLCLTFARKPIIFDELINLVEYYEEHKILRAGTWLDSLARHFYRWQIHHCTYVLADTQAHAAFSAATTGTPRKEFRVLPVAAEEKLFYPEPSRHSVKQPFTVFYYGNGMTPLHGLRHVLEAAIFLKSEPHIRFHLVGGHETAKRACADAVAKGANVTYEEWLPFEEIPVRARTASLCLGGPFGKTLQSQFVITGKTAQFLACGVPVLVGENKASSMFKDKRNCLLVPLADESAIAQAIIWAEAHPEKLQKIGEAGRELYERYFSQRIVNTVVRTMVKDLQHD